MFLITSIYNWCLKNWKGLGIALGSLIAFFIGSKRQKDKHEDDAILLDQSIREAAFIELTREEERRRLIEADRKYKAAMKELEQKYTDKNSELISEKDHIYKQTLSQAKNDPDKLDQILKDMGIIEVKK
jgi:hypothetical protein